MKYPVCMLASILNPGKYCVVSTDKEHVEEVKVLEESMRREMQSHDTSGCQLSCQMYVAVEDFTGQLRRGIIEKKLEDDSYQVLLIDYGRVIKIQKSNIRIITKKEFIEVEPLAFVVRLYGLIPTKNVYMEGIRKARASNEWLEESQKFVQNFLKESQKVLVKSVLIQQRTVYGDLFFKPKIDMKFISLRKLLCKNEFCVFSESNFLRLEGLSVPSNNPELNSKMELVKKWQRENFGEIEKTSCIIPSVKSDTSMTNISFNSSSQNGQTINDSTSKSSVDQLKKLGSGRGKLKLLIEEMKNKEKLSVGKQQNNFRENDEEDNYKENCEQNEEISSKARSSTAEPVEFPNLNNSNKQMESPKDMPPSHQNLQKEKEELKLSPTLPKKPIKKSPKPNGSETKHDSCFSETSSSETNIMIWKEPLRAMKSGCCWTPYVEFDDTVVEPINTFTELPIQSSIIQNLERGGNFSYLSQIQRWAIPTIRKQHNAVIIGSSKTGKTISYIIPLIDFVQDWTYFEELPPGNGPSVVIVASSSRICESIYHMCHSLLGNFTKSKMKKSDIKIVLAHGNGCEKEVWVHLTNGCEILISTPHCLVRLLEHPVLTNFERLNCLILDEIDILSQNPFRKNVRIILEKANFATRDRYYQGIFIGERWTPNVETLVKNYLKSHALIIGSSAEAVIYKKLKPNIHLVDRNDKPDMVLNLLKDKVKKFKTLVVCEKGEEAICLNDFLNERGISCLLAHEKITADRLKGIKACWKKSEETVLVITDEVLNELNIREVQLLVHYELPTVSKTNFYLRYSTLKGFLRDKSSFLNKKGENFNLQNIILVDDENHRQLPHVIEFVTRLGGKIPSKIVNKCEEIRRVIEINKSDTPICRNVLSFGRCRNAKDCPKRHAFVKELDSPKNVPTNGWVNFVVLKTSDASCFHAKLLEQVDSEGNCSTIEDRRSEVIEKMGEFFKNEDNQRAFGGAKHGDVCAVKEDVEDGEIFHRGKIVEVLKTDKHGKALEVYVKLIDEGDIVQRKVTELFELPSELSTHPPTAVDVWVVGIQPMDFDSSWSKIANNFVSELMTQTLQNNQYWSGKIVLALDNTLFLEPIKRKEFLPLLKTHVFDLVVQGELINKRIAVPNKEHLPNLIKMCANDDIDVPKEEERKKEDLAVVQPQWAFFDSDFIKVTFLAAESTSVIFLQPKKFEKLLKNLEEDCQKEAAQTKAQKQKKSDAVTVGMFCLALFEDGKWNRGRVESENETQFQVFFIDHGDFLFVSKTDVIPISQTLLLRLPCQAVECCLVGIQPEEEECPVHVLQEIYSFSEDGKQDLYANVLEKNLKPNVTNGRKYKINLLNTKGVSLNKSLIDKKMASVEESEKKHVEDIEVVDSDCEKDEEETTPGGVESWESHFNNLTDEVFENEEALEFLKEFASTFLPKPTPTSVEKNQPEVPKIKTTPEIQPEKDSGKLKLKTKEDVLTPQILWCQNQLEIQIKITLGNVQDYCLECSVRNVSFRCAVKEKFYVVDLKLFGAINPQMTKVTVKAFHVVVVLTKLAYPLWPRLHADEEKHRWINLDVESLADKEEGDFRDKIESAKLAIESGFTKKGIRCNNIKPYSDSDDEEEEEEINVDEFEEE